MLKRTQILLEDWQIDFVKRAAEVLDFSYSEIVRIFVSEAILCLFFSLGNKEKIGIDEKELKKMRERAIAPDVTTEEKHKILSKLYFEARKAAEHKIGGRI